MFSLEKLTTNVPEIRSGRLNLNPQDIAEAKWILREPQSGARQTFEKALGELLPSINIYLELRHNEAIKNAVESGLGVGCLSEIVLMRNFQSGDLVALGLTQRAMRRTFYFVLHKNRQSPPSEHLNEYLQKFSSIAPGVRLRT